MKVACSPRAKKSKFLVNLDRFSKYLKYLRNFEKPKTHISLLLRHTHYTTLSHHFEPNYTIYHFIADSLLKDAVLTVGVNLRLCLLSLCIWYELYTIT